MIDSLGCIFAIALAALGTAGQTASGGAEVEAALGPRRIVATRLAGPAPVIDGRLDEPIWAEAETATDFVERRPNPGAIASLRTEARVLYDASALFVGVRLLDPQPETITAPYPRRDDETTSDWVFVEIDSRHDRRTAFSFGVNPRGVQVDGVFLNDTEYDVAWNAVWECMARIDAQGWNAEFRIPFSQLVYAVDGAPEADGSAPAVFGVNVYRHNPKRGATSNWSPRLPSLAGVVSNFNELHLRVPPRRARLEIMPYVSATAAGGGSSASGGLDLRAGLGPAFTVTGALHPDFGQVEADPSEVNLTTFETLFGERRPLFVENAGLFAFNLGLPLLTRGDSFASEQAFYSRRIGRPPRLAPPGVPRPDAGDGATLLGAAKLTGRSATGWSLGALAALTDSESVASFKVEPRTEFAVARLAKDFRRGSSAVGAIATFLGRSGMTPELDAVLPRHSVALGLDGRHRFARDEYEATGFVLGSAIEGTAEAVAGVLRGPGHYAQRPDASHLGQVPGQTSATGFAGQARLARVGGEHWRWAIAAHAASPELELNDVGFQRNADWLVALGSLSYQQERPGRRFRRWAVGSSQVGWGWSFGGERRAAVLNLNANADLKNYWGGSLSLDHELPALQTEALRGGPALLMPARDAAALLLYSDTRRTSQLTLDVRGYRERETGSAELALSPALSLRATDRLSLSVGPSIAWTTRAWQCVGTPVVAGRTRYVLAGLDQTTASLTARIDFAFSPRLTLQLYAQPFASDGRFGDYKEVVAPRSPRARDRVRSFDPAQVSRDPAGDGLRIDLGPEGALSLADPTYRVRDLRANLVLRWEYRPGSTLYVVWSQERHAPAIDPALDAARDLFGSLGARPSNRFLVKLSYWFQPRGGARGREGPGSY